MWLDSTYNAQQNTYDALYKITTRRSLREYVQNGVPYTTRSSHVLFVTREAQFLQENMHDNPVLPFPSHMSRSPIPRCASLLPAFVGTHSAYAQRRPGWVWWLIKQTRPEPASTQCAVLTPQSSQSRQSIRQNEPNLSSCLYSKTAEPVVAERPTEQQPAEPRTTLITSLLRQTTTPNSDDPSLPRFTCLARTHICPINCKFLPQGRSDSRFTSQRAEETTCPLPQHNCNDVTGMPPRPARQVRYVGFVSI